MSTLPLSWLYHAMHVQVTNLHEIGCDGSIRFYSFYVGFTVGIIYLLAYVIYDILCNRSSGISRNVP